MRFLVFSVAVAAAVPAAAQQEAAAQQPASVWQFFEEAGGLSGAWVRAANGEQLILKCDKPGRREVHAIVMAPSEKLAAPSARPISRPIRFQFDSKAPKNEDWGFFEHHAIALGKTSDRALAHLLTGLRDSSRVRMILDTGIGPDVDLSFDTAGAQDAITRVYEACNDSVPA